MKGFTCPACGWNVKTTLGENDILDHVEHTPKKDFAELIKDELQKEVNVF